jgi:uncharacterized lipoprotein YddW (UPF0748 family)
MRPPSLPFALLAVIALAACGAPLPEAPPDAAGGGTPDAGEEDADAGNSPPADAGTDAGTNVRRIIALEVTPATLTLQPGGISGVTATALFDDGSQADVSGSVQWSVEPAGVVTVEVVSMGSNLVRVTGVGAGTASIRAKTGSVTCEPSVATVTPTANTQHEVRAIWVTRFAYNSPAHVTTVINKAADAGFNVVYFQIRGAGDAYYQSSLVPWAARLTSPQTLGKDPGWDPLQLAIDTAHSRGLQLHAYWNVYSAWTTPSGCHTAGTCTCQPTQGLADSCILPPASPAGQPTHALRAHPEWMAVNADGKSADSEYYWFSPGNPAVRAHLLAVATELLENYAVDGLHLDRVRYSGSQYSKDAASLAAYNALPAATRPSWEDWQREQVNTLVGDLYELVKQKRPDAVLSASVWGIYKVLPGCGTSQGYSGYYQDSIAWMKRGLIDALVPMIYWDLGTGCTDWGKHLDVFMAGSNGRPIIAGMHALDGNQPKMDRIQARIAYGRGVGAAGHSVFASTYLEAKTSGSPTWQDWWADFSAAAGPYETPAEPPPITWR